MDAFLAAIPAFSRAVSTLSPDIPARSPSFPRKREAIGLRTPLGRGARTMPARAGVRLLGHRVDGLSSVADVHQIYMEGRLAVWVERVRRVVAFPKGIHLHVIRRSKERQARFDFT